MTLCVAALCEQGNPQGAKVVCAVDGMLSHIVSADVNAPKMLFVGDLIFMFAGQLSNADLMMDAIRPVQFSPQEVKTLVRRAYRKRMAQWSADRYLLQYEMDMEEFKSDGRNIFGEERFAALSRSIEQDSVNLHLQTRHIQFVVDRELLLQVHCGITGVNLRLGVHRLGLRVR
jgi:hypothetical protein